MRYPFARLAPAGANRQKELMETELPTTPCIKVCAVSSATGLCIGCGRTLKEIAAWGGLSERERRAIMAELPHRLAAAPAP